MQYAKYPDLSADMNVFSVVTYGMEYREYGKKQLQQ